jgi:hypothetical protein
MGQWRFQIPETLPSEMREALVRSYVAGLPDYMPWPTKCRIQDHELIVEKEGGESGSLYVPWQITCPPAGSGPSWWGQGTRLLTTGTATLGERPEPYHLLTELARGKVNQVRNQAADWQGGGLALSDEVIQGLRQCSLAFARAVCQPNSTADADRLGMEALTAAFCTGDQLVGEYVDQVLRTRKNHAGKLPFYLSCGLDMPLSGMPEMEFLSVFNSVRIPFHWANLEPRESSYKWDRIDALIAWAKQRQLPMEGGPIIDCSPNRLPAWLESGKGDVQSLTNLMLDYLEATLGRYKQDIAFWTITANAHDTTLLGVDEEDLIWMNSQLLSAAKQLYPEGRFSLSLSQPWGEQLANGERTYSAFLFADALLRSRVEITALNLEFAVGWSPRGSALRDFLEASRMLDLYAILGLPLTLYLSMPSSTGLTHRGDSAYQVLDDGNSWSPEFQAAWSRRMVALAASKPYMLSLSWLHWSDAQDHIFAHGGLLNDRGQVKPLINELRELSQTHLQPP